MKPTSLFIHTLFLAYSVSHSVIYAHRSAGNALLRNLVKRTRNDSTYFKEARVYQYNNYGSLEIFQVTVPPGTVFLQWTIKGNANDKSCPGRKIISHVQPDGYPLFTPDGRNPNKTFPSDNFHLSHEVQYEVDVISNDTGAREFIISYPAPGQWFLVAYVSENVDQVIKKITSSNCRYGIQVWTTAGIPRVPVVEDMAFQLPYNISLSTDYVLFRFYISELVWKYNVHVEGCKNSTGHEIECPLSILTRGGSYPSHGIHGTHAVHCNKTSTPCVLTVDSPLLHTWHYLTVAVDTPANVSVNLRVTTSECNSDEIGTRTHKSHGTVQPHRHKNDTTLRFTKHLQKEDSGIKDDGTNDSKNKDSSNSPPRDRSTVYSVNSTDGDDDMRGTGNITAVIDSPAEGGNAVCPIINRLQRVESSNTDFYTTFTIKPWSPHVRLLLPEKSVGLIRFDLMPVKDITGTLRIRAIMKDMNITTQNVTIQACVQVDKLPLNGSYMACNHKSTRFNLTKYDKPAIAYFPYPRIGMWFLAMKAHCFNSNTSQQEPCNFHKTPIRTINITITINIAPCVDDGCGRYGSCQAHSKGAFDVSACSCAAGYQGFACTDGTNATSDKIQLSYTLLLTLSNMFFWPSIIVAIYRRYYAEAVVYFANMFFSTMYHACDVAGMSIFKECVMPYGVLSFCDFFCSIMSFWVTLLAVARLPAPLRPVAQMVGVFGLAMGVEWQTHGQWTYVVPIATGGVIVIISWVVRCVRQKKCYPKKRYLICFTPGIVMAIAGICIFTLIETDTNYPYTHSAWHVCMSLCVVFLLPKRRQIIKDDTASESSDFFPLSGTDTVNLIAADGVAINASTGDDIDL